ncbi:tape measure domain-containing protein [Pedobacter duraquae]|uniref:Tape measure domain-containing protein n=2 Tax=Pedobacter duraquae TaxID=425511 RepID=A0A4R6IIR4_9SPHI|nr:tape measure domain-containing protein [Pedobacter duraquae]
MDSLAVGLKKGESDITHFVNASNTGLKDLEETFKRLGITMSDTKSTKALSAASKQMSADTRQATLDLKSQRLETERQKTETEKARSATERQRAALAASRTELAAHRVATAQNRTTIKAASDSYDEARIRMAALGREIRAAGGVMNATNPAIESMIREYNELNDKLKQVDATMGNHQRNVGDYAGALGGAARTLAGMAAGYLSASALLQAAFDTALKTDGIKTSLEFTFQSVDVAKEKMDGLHKTANRLGLEYIGLADAYRSFAGAAIASNFSLKETDRVFNAVANAGAKLKLSNEQVSGALTALQQMISKGNVQAEELRGQLGERLPGAFAIAARAMGVTQQELGKLLQDGKVLASDLLPKLADELDKTFGNDQNEIVESLGGSVNRVKNAFTEMVETKGAISAFFTVVVDGAAKAVESVGLLSKALGIFYELATDPKKLIGDSARQSRSEGYEKVKKNAAQSAGSIFKNNPEQSDVAKQINHEIDLMTNLEARYKAATAAYAEKRVGDRSLADTQKLQETETMLQFQILLVKNLKTQYDKTYNAAVVPAKVLDSIAAIRKEITELSKQSGSAIKGSDVYNKIMALKAQLKDLLGAPKKDKSYETQFESVAKQLTEFHNKANIVTKEGLAKDLQAWDDQYNKIKAVIDKLPAGDKKTQATQTLQTNYTEGSTAILDANTAKIKEAINKRQTEISSLELAGSAKEIATITAGYDEQVRLAQGNAAAIALIRQQQGVEVAKVTAAQAANDVNVIAAQLAEVAREYREHQADIFMNTKMGSPLAAEIDANEIAIKKLKEQYKNKQVDYKNYQDQMAGLVKNGDVLHALDNFNKQAVDLLNQGVGDMISGTADLLGGLISGVSGVEDFGSMLLGAIGNIASQLGKAAIGIGVAMLGIKSAFTNPFTAIAAGAALLALGGYIKGTVSKMTGGDAAGVADSGSKFGVPHFANGGIVSAPTLAMVGEYSNAKHDPEVISPLSKLKSMIGDRSGGDTYVVSNKISMGELVIAIERQKRNNNRT